MTNNARSPMVLGSTLLKTHAEPISGENVEIEGESYFKISNYDKMSPFLMSIVSDSDHWLFLSSAGGLTAGRKNADSALFPYFAEDKIHDNGLQTGSKTMFRVYRGRRCFLWEPFNPMHHRIYSTTRNLYKNRYGNKLFFEEENADLGLVFRYAWCTSEKFGFVKKSQLINLNTDEAAIDILDGIQNLLPPGTGEFFQNYYSCLADAYKKNEREPETGMGIYSFSSIPGDSAEPAEALEASICWSTGLDNITVLLSSLQCGAFADGNPVSQEDQVLGRRGAYFIHTRIQLSPARKLSWHIMADVNQSAGQIAAIQKRLKEKMGPADIEEDIRRGTANLKRIIAAADGLQVSRDIPSCVHHLSNTLFNVMRGGLFESGYVIDRDDVRDTLNRSNREVAERHAAFLESLPPAVDRGEMLVQAEATGDPDLLRLTQEYLPLSFSRRHGDPSRPWNTFSIEIKNPDGSRVLNYQGNWRDIFQNWEALCFSFPEYTEGFICKFVNTSTADGYNPYRITREGYEWEMPAPGQPWANYGYWGDHQIIYLLKLLEMSRNLHPGALEALLNREIFVYADIPYEIKPYRDLLDDPKNSIIYNESKSGDIAVRINSLGFDGRYVRDNTGRLHHCSLTEKLLVTLLARVSQYIPDAGFWLNTQRPEWNDANNALAGFGVSMVTLYHTRRFAVFLRALLQSSNLAGVPVSEEVKEWFTAVADVIAGHSKAESGTHDADVRRKAVVDELGVAAEAFRKRIYGKSFSGKKENLSLSRLQQFLSDFLICCDRSISRNRRPDGLYHAYHIMEPNSGGISLCPLYEMLEGQVAVISSGKLTAAETLSVLNAMKSSALYRKDQQSYILYPNRSLPVFLEKNILSPKEVSRSFILMALAAKKNKTILDQDENGMYHFNSSFQNVGHLKKALDSLKSRGYQHLVEKEAPTILGMYEACFNHREFTGRSGAFFGYEGLGSIYWHMVSKLLLAVQEACYRAQDRREAPTAIAALGKAYYDIRSGLGFNKTPEKYGAFPTDPYSHTPCCAGARQPGMTGQVKEEIITRLGEFGLRVRAGKIHFEPLLLRKGEFLNAARPFVFIDVTGCRQEIRLLKGELAFTFCQIPILYRSARKDSLHIHYLSGERRAHQGLSLTKNQSADVFKRTGRITKLIVELSLPPHPCVFPGPV